MKLKGYTLLEMLLVLALTGLALAIAWGAWVHFELFGLEYRKRNQDQSELRRLDLALRLDMALAQDLISKRDSILLLGAGAYLPFEGGIIRKHHQQIDSLFFPLESLSIDSSAIGKSLLLTMRSGQTVKYNLPLRATARIP